MSNNTHQVNSSNELVFYGQPLKHPPCHKNIGQCLMDRMELNSNKIAQIDPITKKTYTHGHLRTLSVRCALEMRRRGIQMGDVVTICARNQMNLFVPVLASLYLGVAVNPLHPKFTRGDLQRLIQLTDSKMIFCDLEMRTELKEILNELRKDETEIVVFNIESFDPFILPHDEWLETNFLAQKVDVDNCIAFIQCTSGSTGPVKGITINHRAFYISITEYDDFIDPLDTILIYSGLSWISSIWTMGITIWVGAAKLICEYDPVRNLDIMSKYKVQWCLMLPLMVLEMINQPEFQNYPEIIDNLKCLLIGGAQSTKEQFLEFRRIFKNAFIYNGYASSEMIVCHAFFNRQFPKHRQLNDKKIYSNGLPPPGGIQMKVINSETGQSLSYNQVGELLLKGPSLTQGYFMNSTATRQAIDADGWFHSGDNVYIDEDDCLFIVGRTKEALKYRGWQVPPGEIEDVVLKHPAVKQVCVIGKPHPIDGDHPLAFVIKNVNMMETTEEEIERYVNNQVADIQKLRGGVIFINEMPVSPLGKILKRELKKLIPTM